MRAFCGYHGTSSEFAAGIERTGFRPEESDELWLGSGIYFYEEIGYAREWAERKFGRHGFTIVIFGIEFVVRMDEVLDLLTREDMQIFVEVFDRLDKRARLLGAKLTHHRDGEVINFICSEIMPNIKVVRGVFSKATAYTRRNISRIRETPIEFAVRDVNCIQSRQRVEEGIQHGQNANGPCLFR